MNKAKSCWQAAKQGGMQTNTKNKVPAREADGPGQASS